MPNRSIAPLISAPGNICLPEVEIYRLDNGIPVYEINAGTQEVLKLEVIVDAGRAFEQKANIGKATMNQLKEGTKQFTAPQIAQKLDYHGSAINYPFNLDTSNAALFCLRKHFGEVLPILESMIREPIFPETELRSYVSRSAKKLEIELAKNDVVAYRLITEKIFGSEHPYGYNSAPDTYSNILREDLVRHHQMLYNASNIRLVFSGKTTGLRTVLNQALGDLPLGSAGATRDFVKHNSPSDWVRVDNEQDHLQTAIRIGAPLFNRQHPDYLGCYVLINILGGYFGSRLMTNIREDKGYTYNIYSTVDTMIRDGCFYIATEVGNDFVENTLTEIEKEVNTLKEQLVSEEELNTVKNYLLGNLLTLADGPFNTSELVKGIVIDELPLTFMEHFVEGIRGISSGEIKRLAEKYFDWEKMWKVIVE